MGQVDIDDVAAAAALRTRILETRRATAADAKGAGDDGGGYASDSSLAFDLAADGASSGHAGIPGEESLRRRAVWTSIRSTLSSADCPAGAARRNFAHCAEHTHPLLIC